MLSQLHGNLVLLFYDYLTEKPFLSFIGKNYVAYTASMLIEYSIQKFQEPCLKLIPECVAAAIQCNHFEIIPDEDSHDYILSVPYLCSLPGLSCNSNPGARGCKKYFELYPHHAVATYGTNDIPVNACIDLFKRWAKGKSLNHLELNEYSAFVRFIHNKECNSKILAIYDNRTMIGFAAYELLTEQYVMGHFLKADSSYSGLNEALHFHVSKQLIDHNILYWNYEQDLGIPQLRQSKRKYKPEFYLKKFTVQRLQP